MSGTQEGLLPFAGALPAPPPGHDPDVDAVGRWFQHRQQAVGKVIRQAFDQVLDAERTGRYDLDGLTTIETAYLADRLRILLRDEFNLPRGPGSESLPLGVDGVGVEVTFLQAGGWRMPESSVGDVCLLIDASDEQAKFSMGVARVESDMVVTSTVRRVAIVDESLSRVWWLVRDADMPANVLRQLSPTDIQAIFAQSGRGNGQARINELFRRVQGQIIPRQLTTTVAHQSDPMKRGRTARSIYQASGFVILGHWKKHQAVAESFGLPVPTVGELLCVRVLPATPQRQAAGRAVAVIEGKNWVQALPHEPEEPGPANY